METIDGAILALLDSKDDDVLDGIKHMIPKFSEPLKTNFEDTNLWLRFGLALSLSGHYRDAIQSFNECLRIDQDDPLPAMLAAKIFLVHLDDPESGLKLANDAIERCKINSHYKNITPLLSKCYLLASIMNAHIYEREPESIKQFRASNLEASLNFLDLAKKTYTNDYLLYFHIALHEARQKSYQSAIDNIRQAIRLNPDHVPSMQLLILSLSALKLYEQALVLCESTLREFEDNLLLLYIKCNLEQCLTETKGYKSALNTAQHVLKCIRKTTTGTTKLPANGTPASNGITVDSPAETNKHTVTLFAEEESFKGRNKTNLISGESSVWLLVAEIFIKIGSINDAELCVDEGSNHVNVALSHQIMFIRGLIAKAKSNLMEAKSFFQSSLAINPRYASALQEMAHVHYLLGNYSTAEKFLKDSLDIDSDCHKTWHYLSLVFIETNQHDKANECAKKASILEESSPVISISAISRLTLD